MDNKRLAIIDHDGFEIVVRDHKYPEMTGPHWEAGERLHGRLRASRTLVSVEVRLRG